MLKIETDRLVLRTPMEDDVIGYLSYRNNLKDLDSHGLGVMSEEDARKFLISQKADVHQASGWKMFLIEPKNKLRECVVAGEVGVFLPNDWTGSGDIGWWLHPQARSEGFATEAVGGLLRWCFQTLELHRVTAACLARNERSLRLMQRLGMRIEATRLESRRVADLWLDEIECALLFSEWNARQLP